MKRLFQWISLPLLLLVGLALIGPQTAEAAKWRRHVRHSHVHHYVAPVAVYAAPVRVYVPAVAVQVGPAVHVTAPGVRVNVGTRYPSYYRGPYYRW